MSLTETDPLLDLLPATPLRSSVYEALRIYFHNLGDQQPNNLYELVLCEVERPLLEIVLQRTHGNQTRAAALLGINRSTLRKKLRQHDMQHVQPSQPSTDHSTAVENNEPCDL